MTSKHTPGPWSYDDSRDGSCWSVACTPDGCHETHATGIYVVDGPAYDAENGPAYGLALTNEADARLISAAPELLAALQAMVESGEFNDWDGRSEAQANARAAIAKATGQ